MSDIIQIADLKIPQPTNKRVVKFENGRTEDIITTILTGDNLWSTETKQFAPVLKGDTDVQTAFNVWQFVKNNIKYVLDPAGYQYVKSPAKTWADRYGDCKSRSLFQGSIFKNLGIPFAYRFAGYIKNGSYTHVYVVVTINGKVYVSDPDMEYFNLEKPTAKHLDKHIIMSKIEMISGIGLTPMQQARNQAIEKSRHERSLNYNRAATLANEKSHERSLRYREDLELKHHKKAAEMHEWDMDLAITHQRDRIEKWLLQRIQKATGTLKQERYNDRLHMNEVLQWISKHKDYTPNQKIRATGIAFEMIQKGHFDNAHAMMKITDLIKREAARKHLHKKSLNAVHQHLMNGHKPYIGKKGKGHKNGLLKLLKKAGKSFVDLNKKLLKGSLDVALFPLREAIKIPLEIALPKAGPFFIYLFITNPATLAALPDNIRAKRAKQVQIAKVITGAVKMKESHMMGLFRNGIMKHYGKSPEAVLTGMVKGSINGIGIIDDIIKFVMEIIGMISKILKKSKVAIPSVSASDAPDPSELSNLPAAAAQAVTQDAAQGAASQTTSSDTPTAASPYPSQSTANPTDSSTPASDGSDTPDPTDSQTSEKDPGTIPTVNRKASAIC